MPHKVTVTESTMLTYFTNCLSHLKRSAEESQPRYPYFYTTMHLLTGHRLDKPLYLNVDLKKRAIHHIRHRRSCTSGQAVDQRPTAYPSVEG